MRGLGGSMFSMKYVWVFFVLFRGKEDFIVDNFRIKSFVLIRLCLGRGVFNWLMVFFCDILIYCVFVEIKRWID